MKKNPNVEVVEGPPPKVSIALTLSDGSYSENVTVDTVIFAHLQPGGDRKSIILTAGRFDELQRITVNLVEYMVAHDMILPSVKQMMIEYLDGTRTAGVEEDLYAKAWMKS